MGVGQTHHFAFALADDASQAEWRERLRAAGVSVTPVMDRVYFHSIYFRDPDGHLLEYLSMLDGEPRAQLGIVPYSRWMGEHA